MKKIFYALFVTTALLATTHSANAQAWQKDTKILALGLGAAQFFHIGNGLGWTGAGLYGPITGQLSFQGEFGIHDYVGLGFTTGIGGGGALGGWWSEVNVPVGMIANFHFYQLIADKTGNDIHADKLDVYGGVNVGSGMAAVFNGGGTTIVPLVFGGFQVGARYYFTDKFGVNAELGYGKSIINGGVVFKL